MAALPLSASAAPSASPSPAPAAAPADASGAVRNGGLIRGKIVTIDYQNSTLGLAGPSGRIDVSVLPSTSIQGRDSGYKSFTDLKTGQFVEIDSSVANGKYTAQIIHVSR